MFCIKGADGSYVEVNDAFVRRTGKGSKREVIGRKASEVFIEELAERYEAQDKRVLETGRALRDELELIGRSDGVSSWYLTTKLPIIDRDVAPVVVGDQLERRVRRVFGISPKQYVMRARVDTAARLLAQTDLTLADIANQSGFYDQSDFTRRFARLTNYTPASYRLSLRTDKTSDVIQTRLPKDTS